MSPLEKLILVFVCLIVLYMVFSIFICNYDQKPKTENFKSYKITSTEAQTGFSQFINRVCNNIALQISSNLDKTPDSNFTSPTVSATYKLATYKTSESKYHFYLNGFMKDNSIDFTTPGYHTIAGVNEGGLVAFAYNLDPCPNYLGGPNLVSYEGVENRSTLDCTGKSITYQDGDSRVFYPSGTCPANAPTERISFGSGAKYCHNKNNRDIVDYNWGCPDGYSWSYFDSGWSLKCQKDVIDIPQQVSCPSGTEMRGELQKRCYPVPAGYTRGDAINQNKPLYGVTPPYLLAANRTCTGRTKIGNDCYNLPNNPGGWSPFRFDGVSIPGMWAANGNNILAKGYSNIIYCGYTLEHIIIPPVLVKITPLPQKTISTSTCSTNQPLYNVPFSFDVVADTASYSGYSLNLKTGYIDMDLKQIFLNLTPNWFNVKYDMLITGYLNINIPVNINPVSSTLTTSDILVVNGGTSFKMYVRIPTSTSLVIDITPIVILCVLFKDTILAALQIISAVSNFSTCGVAGTFITFISSYICGRTIAYEVLNGNSTVQAKLDNVDKLSKYITDLICAKMTLRKTFTPSATQLSTVSEQLRLDITNILEDTPFAGWSTGGASCTILGQLASNGSMTTALAIGGFAQLLADGLGFKGWFDLIKGLTVVTGAASVTPFCLIMSTLSTIVGFSVCSIIGYGTIINAFNTYVAKNTGSDISIFINIAKMVILKTLDSFGVNSSIGSILVSTSTAFNKASIVNEGFLKLSNNGISCIAGYDSAGNYFYGSSSSSIPTSVTSTTSTKLYNVSASNGKVFGLQVGTNYLYYNDGSSLTNWTKINTGSTTLSTISFDGIRDVIMGMAPGGVTVYADSNIYNTPNLTKNQITLPSASYFTGLSYSNGKAYAIDTSGTLYYTNSPNSSSWNQVTMPSAGSKGSALPILCRNVQFDGYNNIVIVLPMSQTTTVDSPTYLYTTNISTGSPTWTTVTSTIGNISSISISRGKLLTVINGNMYVSDYNVGPTSSVRILTNPSTTVVVRASIDNQIGMAPATTTTTTTTPIVTGPIVVTGTLPPATTVTPAPSCPANYLTSTNVGDSCYTKIWGESGCITKPYYGTWQTQQTGQSLKYDSLAHATMTDDSHRSGCYTSDKTLWPPKPIPSDDINDIKAFASSYLNLGSNFLDSGINSKTLSINGSVTRSIIEGRRCSYFNNNLNNYVSFPFTNTDYITVSFWFYQLNAAYYTIASISNSSSSSPVLQFDCDGSNVKVFVSFPSNTPWTCQLVSPSITVNTWNFVALTINQNNYSVELYVNKNTTPVTREGTGRFPTTATTWIIGKSGDNYRAFNGYISDFTVFDGIAYNNQIVNIYYSTINDLIRPIIVATKTSGNVQYITNLTSTKDIKYLDTNVFKFIWTCVSNGKTFAVDINGDLSYTTNNTFKKNVPNPSGIRLAQITFDGYQHVVMGIGSDQSIWYANKNIYTAPNWTRIGGSLTNVSYSNGQAYGCNGWGNIYYASSAAAGNWVQIPGGLSCVELDGYNNIVVGSNSNGNCYYANNARAGNWVNMPGGGITNISYSNGKMVCVSSGNIYFATNFTTGNWVYVGVSGYKQVSYDDPTSYNKRNYLQYTQTGTDIGLPITGTLYDCQNSCDANTSCIGFSRGKQIVDNAGGQCYLKQSAPYVTYNDATWNTYVKPSKTPSWPRKIVGGNNGSVSCDTYCGGIGGGPWNGELPREWNGATCVDTNNQNVGCKGVAGSPIECVCEPTSNGWTGSAPVIPGCIIT